MGNSIVEVLIGVVYELSECARSDVMLGLIDQFLQGLHRKMFDHFGPCPFLDLLALDVAQVLHECVPTGGGV